MTRDARETCRRRRRFGFLDWTLTAGLPSAQQLYNVESEIEETDYDSLEETSSVLSTEEWEDESDSWETDNGLTTEDDGHANNADASDTATPTPTPTATSPYIIPPAEGGRGQQSPSRAASAEETEEAASSAASAAGRTVRLSSTQSGR